MFGFGRGSKKNKQREQKNVHLRRPPSLGYDNADPSENNDAYYPEYDQRLMHPYRTADANAHRDFRRLNIPPQNGLGQNGFGPNDLSQSGFGPNDFNQSGFAKNDFDDNALLGFRRAQPSHEDNEDYDHDAYAYARRPTPGYDPRLNSPYNRAPKRAPIEEPAFWPENDENAQYDDSEVDADRPSPVKFIVAVTGLVFIGTVMWFAYRWISLPAVDTPPLIQAEPTPYRVRPDNPGGTDFPHQDKLIYGRLAPTTERPVERLLPPPEEPVIIAPTYSQPRQHNEQQVGMQPIHQHPSHQQPLAQNVPPSQGVPQGVPQDPYYQGQPGQSHQSNQGHNGPSQVIDQQQYPSAPSNQGLPVQYSQNQPTQMGQVVPQKAFPAEPFASTEGKIPQQVPVQAVAVNSQKQNQQPAQQQMAPNLNGLPRNQTDQRPTAQNPMAQNPALKTEQTDPSKANQKSNLDESINSAENVSSSPSDKAFYALQLGTLASEDIAKKEKARLQKRYAAELKGIDLSIRPFNASDGSKKYRIMTGPVIQSRKAAIDKCATLGNACMPIRN